MSESHLALRLGIAASVAVHLAVMLAGLGYAGFLLVPSGPEQTIAVDLVTPQEVAELTKPPEPQSAPPAPEKGNEPPAEAPPPQPSPSQQEAAKPEPVQQAKAPRPETLTAQTPAATAKPPAAIRTPEPDISVRYPMNLSMFGSVPGDFNAKASMGAQIDSGAISTFRAQLKSCSTLPPEIAADDKVVIVIRAQFAPDGRLAATPILIEASASAKGPLLMQAAIAALQACQPYASLPADKYQEWKLLDLRFAPQDFRRG